MVQVHDPPTELLAALTTDWCERYEMLDGGVALKIGRWIAVRQLAEDEDGEPVIVASTYFRFASEHEADVTLENLIEEPVG